MTQEALKLALEWFEKDGEPDHHPVVTAIKEALAQPEQEPVAWRKREVGGGWQYYGWEETGMTYEAVNRFNKNGLECEAIPANPPQRTEQEPVALPCCGYADSSAIKWNPYSQVVQCHNCGQVYTPQRQPLTQEQRDAIVRPAVPNDWNDYEVIDAVEAAHGIKE